jgi:hypothetical protein
VHGHVSCNYLLCSVSLFTSKKQIHASLTGHD